MYCEAGNKDSGIRKTWVPALPSPGCVITGKLLNLSESQFSLVTVDNTTYFHLAQCLAPRRCLLTGAHCY